jgi:hypothetical protein
MTEIEAFSSLCLSSNFEFGRVDFEGPDFKLTMSAEFWFLKVKYIH